MSILPIRRNSSPHVVSSSISRLPTPPRKISQPVRLTLNNNESSDSENEGGRRKWNSYRELISPPMASSASSSSSSCLEDNDVCTPNQHLIYDRLFSLGNDLLNLANNIKMEAKNLCHAETCSFFLLDPNTRELVADIPMENGTLERVRLDRDKGVVGRVLSTKKILRIRNVDRCSFFYRNIDDRTGFRTRNILCFPILGQKGEVLGVIELCNRVGKSHFTRHDLLVASSFAVYCASAISHCILTSRLRETHRRSHMAGELGVQGSQLLVDPKKVARLSTWTIPQTSHFSPHFSSFHFTPRSIGDDDNYIEASIAIFSELGFLNMYGIERRYLAAFMIRVAQGYRPVPYHNWSHAFAVAHFAFLLLRTPAVKSQLNELERLALLISCLCHDIDHRGTTNSFQKQMDTPLAQLYSSEGSVLERHHFQQTLNILQQPECDILANLTERQHRAVLDHVKDIILATDIAQHIAKVGEMRKMVVDGVDRCSTRHHYLLTCLLMTASDLSDQTKDFHNSKGIAHNIYHEFFYQGDMEKEMGNAPSEMMDRERACVPRVQIEFIDTVALPVFDMLSSAVPQSIDSFQSLVYNRRAWCQLEEIFKERGVTGNGLEYLNDEELEKEVLERVESRPNPREETEKALLSLEWKPLCLSKLDPL